MFRTIKIRSQLLPAKVHSAFLWCLKLFLTRHTWKIDLIRICGNYMQFCTYIYSGYQNNLKVLYSQNKTPGTARKTTRHIPQVPERILDAPEMLDDYCKNPFPILLLLIQYNYSLIYLLSSESSLNTIGTIKQNAAHGFCNADMEFNCMYQDAQIYHLLSC